MSLGTTPWSQVAIDPFALYRAMEDHKAAADRIQRDLRRKVRRDNEEKESRRKHARQRAALLTGHLHKMRLMLSQVETSGAPPSSAALFDVETTDKRRPQVHHAGCQVIDVKKWSAAHVNSRNTLHARHDSVQSTSSRCPQDTAGISSNALVMDCNAVKSALVPRPPRSPSHARPGRSQQPYDTVGSLAPPLSAGLSGGGTLVPLHNASGQVLTLPSIERLSARIVMNAEQDFASFSYGETHAQAAVFLELAEDMVLDLAGRRVPAGQFAVFFRRTKQPCISFAQYLHVAYAHPLDECTTAVKKWSTQFGWASGLSESTTRLIQLLWRKWTNCGTDPFTEATFLEMNCGSQRDPQRVDDLKLMFAAADIDSDGRLDMKEFATFFANGESES